MEQNDFNKLRDELAGAKQEGKLTQDQIDALVKELLGDQAASVLIDAILEAKRRKGHRHWPPPWRPWVYEETPEKQKKFRIWPRPWQPHIAEPKTLRGWHYPWEFETPPYHRGWQHPWFDDRDLDYLPSLRGWHYPWEFETPPYQRGWHGPWDDKDVWIPPYCYTLDREDLVTYLEEHGFRMTQEEIDKLLEKLKEQGILKSIGLSQREIDNLLKRGDGFTDQEVKDIVDYANSLKSALQSDIDFLDEVIEQVQDPTRAGLTPEQLARMNYISKHNAPRGRFPHGWPFPHDMERVVITDAPRPKGNDYFIPRMTQKEIDDLLAKLKEQGILKSADVKVVLDGIIDMFKNMEPKTRGLVQAIAHMEKIQQMLKDAGY